MQLFNYNISKTQCLEKQKKMKERTKEIKPVVLSFKLLALQLWCFRVMLRGAIRSGKDKWTQFISFKAVKSPASVIERELKKRDEQ